MIGALFIGFGIVVLAAMLAHDARPVMRADLLVGLALIASALLVWDIVRERR